MKKNNIVTHIPILFLSLLTLFFAVSFIFWTVIPHLQMTQYYQALKKINRGDFTVLSDTSGIFSPYTYVQPELRNNLIFFLIRGNEDKSKRERLGLLPFALKKMEETYSYDQTYAKYSLALAKGYDVVAMLAPTEEKQQYLAKAEVYYKKSLALRSSSQEILYPYALNLINQKRAPEALMLLEASRLQEPRVREVHHYIGLAYYSLGSNYYDRSLEQFERALGDTEEFIEQLKKESLMTKKDQETIRENHDVDKSVTEVVYNNLFSYYYQKKDIPHFLTVLNRLEYFNEKQADIYTQIEAYIVKNNALPLITIQ